MCLIYISGNNKKCPPGSGQVKFSINTNNCQLGKKAHLASPNAPVEVWYGPANGY